MKRSDKRSHCPVNFALESFGDPWSLLIIRDIVFWGKHTYGDFLNSGERISTNILSSRLKRLEKAGILFRVKDGSDRRKELYSLTERGLQIIPILLEMSGWSSNNDPETIAPKDFVASVYADRKEMFVRITEHIRNGGSLFGPNPFIKGE